MALVAYLLLAVSTVRIAAVGDVFFGRLTKPDFYHPDEFGAVKSAWQGYDVVFCNLETPITSDVYRGRRAPYRYKKLTFRARPEAAKILKDAGFNLVSLANNHAWDQGARGMNETFLFLKAQGIEYIGAGNDEKDACSVLIKEINGVRVGFAAVTNVLNFDVPAKNPAVCYVPFKNLARGLPRRLERIKSTKSIDFMVLSLHYGIEYKKALEPNEIRMARIFRKHGIDVVLGHHPHVLRPVDRDAGGVVFWSLGNFHFDTAWGWRGLSAIALVTLEKRDDGTTRIASASLRPVVLQYPPRGEPRFTNAAVGWAIYDMLRKRSRGTRTRLTWKNPIISIGYKTRHRRHKRHHSK